MTRIRRFASTRTGKMVLAAGIVVALSAPAMAEHFDFDSLVGDAKVTAADLHVECPEPEEGVSEEDAQKACDEAVQAVAQDLADYDHPENHGKYVSFLAHCLKGMKGKGEKMRQVAQADEANQMEVAVQLCSEWKLEQEASEDDESLSSNGKGKKKSSVGDDDDDELDSESEESKGGKGKGKGKGRRK